MARRLAEALGVPHVELDALHWGPDWTPATSETFRERVRRATSGDAWVVDGNYRSKIGTLVWRRADTVVWVDPPRRLVMWRCLTRTVRRAATRQELWNGNREDWRGLMVWRGAEESILWWAWTSYGRNRERYAAAMTDPANAGLTFHRLRTRHDADVLVETLTRR